MTRLIRITTTLLLAAGLSTAGLLSVAAEEIPLRQYFYNHPHQVPPDYVYRTGRLFSPPASGSPAGAGSGHQQAGGEEKQESAVAGPQYGQALTLKIEALARQLFANAEEEIADQFTVAVSSFVNLNQLYRTSSLGRYVSEQLMGELQVAGVEVIELRRTPSIMISSGGEHALSRDMNELVFIHRAHATLVGTYTVVEDQLFINARLLRNQDSKVLSSGALVMALDPVTRGMLADEALPATGASSSQVKIRGMHE
jgi:TolB-like protein